MQESTPGMYGCFVMFSGPVTKKVVQKVINARKRAERLEAKQSRRSAEPDSNANAVATIFEGSKG